MKGRDILNNAVQNDVMEDAFLLSVIKTQDVMYVITKPHREGKAQTDLTGRFPVKSTRGSEYIFIMYDYDSNAILATTLKNRSAKTITDA